MEHGKGKGHKKFSGLLSLPAEITAKALAGRKILRIHCCGFLMQQTDLHSVPPRDGLPLGVSQVVLRCAVCRSKIGLEVVTDSNTSREEVLKHCLRGYQQEAYHTQIRQGYRQGPFPAFTRRPYDEPPEE